MPSTRSPRPARGKAAPARTMKRAKSPRSSNVTTAASAATAAAEPADTRQRILDAAFRRLAAEGYAALSVREIARDAGLNHALINYYFGSKEQLVVEVFASADEQRVQRQKAMYLGEGGFAHKWRQARRYYDGDLESGYVRVLIELIVASYSDKRLRSLFAPKLGRWKAVIRQLTQPALDAAHAAGVKLPEGFDDEVAATLIQSFWVGMELHDLFGKPEDRVAHARALDLLEALFAALDARTVAGGKAPPGKAKGDNDERTSGDVPAHRGPAARTGAPARRASAPVRNRRTGP